MRRLVTGWLALGLAAGFLAAGGWAAPAAAPYAGTWAVNVLTSGQEITVWVVKIEDRDGKPDLSVVAGLDPLFKAAKVLNVAADAKALHFTLQAKGTDFKFTAHPPRAADKTKALLGCVQLNEQFEPAVLEPTEKTELDRMKDVRRIPGFDELLKLTREEDPKEKAAGMKALLEKHAGQPLELIASQALAQAEAQRGAPAKEVKAAADRAIEAAAAYGPQMKLNAAYQVAQALTAGKDPAPAVEYARQAVELLPKDESATRTSGVLQVLAKALRKAGKTEEVKEVEGRLARLDDAMDREFAEKAVPFKTEPFAGRKGNSDRVAVVELFTGAQCPPCVSADIAFDAGLKTYKPGDVVFLQYHLHIPGPDALTNPDTEARQEYYGQAIRGTPTMFLDGKVTAPMGGFRPHGKDRFDTLSSLVNKAVETEPGARVKLKVERKGDRIDLAADVSDLKNPGDKVRLRFVVVEDVVRYAGNNGQRLHHHVVRSFPGGVEGFALKEKSSRQTAGLELAGLHKSLEKYLGEFGGGKTFPADEARPLDLKHLKVVAFVQDDESKEILQAAQADVPDAK
jgi:hypothetical protein